MLYDQEGIALPKTRDVSHIWDHVEPGWPLHLWTDGKGAHKPLAVCVDLVV